MWEGNVILSTLSKDDYGNFRKHYSAVIYILWMIKYLCRWIYGRQGKYFCWGNTIAIAQKRIELILTTLGGNVIVLFLWEIQNIHSNFWECSPQSLMVLTLLVVSHTILKFSGVTVPTTSTTTTTTTPAPTLPVSATSPLSTDAPGVISSTSVSSSTTTTLSAGGAGRIGQDGK